MPLTGTRPKIKTGIKKLKIDPERFALLEEFAQLARQEKFTLVVINPPSTHPAGTPERALFLEYAALLRVASAEYGFLVFDESLTVFPPEQFYDSAHLNREGAAIFSAKIAERLTALAP